MEKGKQVCHGLGNVEIYRRKMSSALLHPVAVSTQFDKEPAFPCPQNSPTLKIYRYVLTNFRRGIATPSARNDEEERLAMTMVKKSGSQ